MSWRREDGEARRVVSLISGMKGRVRLACWCRKGAWGAQVRAGRLAYGVRPRSDIWPPLRLVRLRFERESVGVVLPGFPMSVPRVEGGVVVRRTFALDVHKRFAEVALSEEGRPARRWGRITTTPADLAAFAEQLCAEDEVVVESTSITWAIVDLLAVHAGRVMVSNPLRTRAIASAKVKTDKIDARVLADLGAADFLPAVWAPDAATRALRRRVAHRSSLVRQRTALRNQIHAILARNLVEVAASDLFGRRGRMLLGAGRAA